MIRHAFIKLGMTSAFAEAGEAKGVTVLRLQPAKVVRHDKLKDGRTVVVVEYDTGNKKKPCRGFAVKSTEGLDVGTVLKSPDLKVGEKIKMTGVSKGCGFQGVIVRYNFSGGPGAHGSRFHRAPGSVGMRTEPGRTIKGKKLPGQLGNVQVSIPSAKVAYWSEEESILAVVGGVPGCTGRVVFV